MGSFKPFGPIDTNKHGKRASEYPGWYFNEQVDELKETIASSERTLRSGAISDESKELLMERLRADKERLTSILDSLPKVSEADRTRLLKFRADMGSRIAEAMFTYSDMQRGTADAHEEAKRMSEPCISIKDETGDIAAIVKACGVEHVSPKGQITRTDAERAWKIISGYLEENTNTETLRKRQ